MGSAEFSPLWSEQGAQKKDKYTEEKVKVIAAVWGAEFIQFHAALVFFLPRTILINRMYLCFSFLSNHPGEIHPIIQNRPVQNSYRGPIIEFMYRSVPLCTFQFQLDF